MDTKPKTSPIAVVCIVVLDAHGSTHAFKFDWTPDPKRGAKVASFHEFTAQTHEWAKTQPFDKGEGLKIGTSALADPGAARLDPNVLWWGTYFVER